MVMLWSCTVNVGGLGALVVVVLCVLNNMTQKDTGRSQKIAYECPNMSEPE
jgi:hypothetical protein